MRHPSRSQWPVESAQVTASSASTISRAIRPFLSLAISGPSVSILIEYFLRHRFMDAGACRSFSAISARCFSARSRAMTAMVAARRQYRRARRSTNDDFHPHANRALATVKAASRSARHLAPFVRRPSSKPSRWIRRLMIPIASRGRLSAIQRHGGANRRSRARRDI